MYEALSYLAYLAISFKHLRGKNNTATHSQRRPPPPALALPHTHRRSITNRRRQYRHAKRQFLRQYLYFCTSKASKLSTSERTEAAEWTADAESGCYLLILYQAFSYYCMRPSATSVSGLKLLLYAESGCYLLLLYQAFSYYCIRP